MVNEPTADSKITVLPQMHRKSTMNWINQFYIAGILPLTQRSTHRGLASKLAIMNRLESNSVAQNAELQKRSLKNLLQHAYQTSPFYRRRFENAGLLETDLEGPSCLNVIPVLTRDEIRSNLDNIRSTKFAKRDLWPAATGGTTDTPVPLLRDPESVRQKIAVQTEFDSWAGFLPGTKALYLWGARSDFSENPSWRWRLYDRYLMRRIWAPTSLFNPEVLKSYLETMNRFRPDIIYAYPTPLYLFCEYVRDQNLRCHQPLSAICTAQPLLAHQRAVIQDVLGCPVFEHYGSREFGMIAAECERHEGLHVNPLSCYLEFIPRVGGDSSGLCELLVTDLLNFGAPLIRYKVNDCAVPETALCSCGRGFPLIKQVVGRSTDVFVLSNGDSVPGIALTNRVLRVCPGLKKVQIIQRDLNDFTIRYVPGQGFTSSDLDLLRDNLSHFFTAAIIWTFEEVADIARERSGKTRFCISYVSEKNQRPQLTKEPSGE